TGKLGDVMQESAKAALSYIKSHAQQLGVELADLDASDLHIHVPAGAVPKDGPSAGVTMFTALVSLFSGRRVRTDTAMTGECTLRGRVLPVGGIKAKVLAAHRAGIRRIILPEQNRRDIDDVPEAALVDLEILFVQDMADVLHEALETETGQLSVVPGTGDSGSAPNDPPVAEPRPRESVESPLRRTPGRASLHEAAALGADAACARFELGGSLELLRVGPALAAASTRAAAALGFGVTLLAQLAEHDGFATLQLFASF